jgi:hypothetical protein
MQGLLLDTQIFGVKGMRMLNNTSFFVKPSRRSCRTLETNKLVEFQTNLRGRALKWYMKSIELGIIKGNLSLYPGEEKVYRRILVTSVRAIFSLQVARDKKRDGESTWEYNQIFKDDREIRKPYP